MCIIVVLFLTYIFRNEFVWWGYELFCWCVLDVCFNCLYCFDVFVLIFDVECKIGFLYLSYLRVLCASIA